MFKVGRTVVYTGLIVGFLAGLPWLVREEGIMAFAEEGLIERGQLAIVSLCSFLLLLHAWRYPAERALLSALGWTAAFAAVRECDGILDRWNPLWGWKACAAAIVAAGGWQAWRGRHKLWPQWVRFVSSSAFGILWLGFLIVVAFAQLVGDSKLVQAVMAESYDWNVKRAVQESAELFGYLVLLVGTLETLLQARAQRASPKNVGH